jgi:hypothetical protein
MATHRAIIVGGSLGGLFAAQFLADAIVASGGDLDAALLEYDMARRRFGARVVARARMLGAHLDAREGERWRTDRYARPEVILRECGANLADIAELAAVA